MSVRSRAYDLVLNGWELGSRSIRIHEPELQQRIFTLIGVSPEEEPTERFGFFLNPFRYGAPPTAASPSASTAWWPSWPARTTSGRSSPSPSPDRAWIR